jgi:PAS domain S-box-containing protein
MKLTLERQIPLVFAIAILLLIIVVFFAFGSMNSLTRALSWEKHTQQVLSQLDETLRLVIDAETGGRGFIITREDSFLEPYTQAQQKIDGNLAQLHTLIEDNDGQKEKVSRLENIVRERLDVLKQAVEMRRSGNSIEAVQGQIGKNRGRDLMTEVRLLIEDLKTEEKNLLAGRETDLNKSLTNTYRMLYLSSIAGILSLGLANFAVFREIGKRRKAEDELRDANKDLEARVEERTSELSQTNEELKEQIRQREQSENRHRVALEAGNLGTWMFDAKDGRTEIDERSLSLFGFSAEDFDGNTFSRIHREDAPRIEELLQKSIRENTNFDAQFRVVAAGGKVRWTHCTGQTQVNENDKVTHIVGNCRDITESREAEIVLKNSEEFNRSIFENSPDCVKVLNLDGTLSAMNVNGLCIMEIDDFDSFVGTQWVDFWDGDENEMAYQAVESARTGKAAHFEGFCRTAKGTAKWWDVSVAPIFGADGKPVRLISTSRDITYRREAETEREELLRKEQAARRDAEIANRLRDEFLATVSHELRAPLNSILGWGRLLERGNLDEKTTQKALGTIVRNAEAQNRLIDDLLDVSRIISGKLRLEVLNIKPINFVEAALETVRPAADAKCITLEVKSDSDVSHISGDPNRLQQVIWNLVSNAIKFTPNGGKVTVEIERIDECVEIKVKDTGIGIREEFLPHVFDRFRQADASSIRKFGGLGLGLAIVRHITEMHGGTVSVDSEGENQGSTFTVSLPVITDLQRDSEIEETAKSMILGASPRLSLDGLLILAVDDEEDTRQLLVQSLTFYGATVITAKSAGEGLMEVIDKNPDVLVSDIGMPDEDGYSLIRKVRALSDEQHKNVKAIALTAFTRAQDRMRALSAGYQNHVAKPVEPDELATVIASLTGRLQIEDLN